MIIPTLQLEPLEKKNKYKLLEGALYKIKSDEYIIEKGFIYDGASIPKIFWSIIGGAFHPDFMKAALLHDYMYIEKLGRKKADSYFYKILIECGVGKLKAKLMYLAVRWFGKKPYNREV